MAAPSRREFLQQLSGATLLATAGSLPRFLARSALAATAGTDQRILVVVQLSGGNDGLNTVVPVGDDRYHRARPSLRIEPQRALKLNETLALHPDMPGFKRLFDEARLSVIMNVGYPNPDRSHFRSMDIWHTASDAPERAADGWLGRVVDRLAPAGGSSAGISVPAALHLDSESLPLALKSATHAVPSIRSIDAFQLQQQDAGVEQAIAADRDAAADQQRSATSVHDDLLFVQRTALVACANARRIRSAEGRVERRANYPDYGLSRRLEQIARLIAADFGPRIYYTSLGGFDTHARQVLAHGPLLRELADSTAAFLDDLKSMGLEQRVLLLTFSEFGRRVQENGSQGTDHGVAAPMFLAGTGCVPGVHGEPPDLVNLVDGDIRHERDFREVYAAVLERWLGVPSTAVLGRAFQAAEVVRA